MAEIEYVGIVKTVNALTDGYGENARTVGVTVEAEVAIPDPDTTGKTLTRTMKVQLPLEAKPYPNITDKVNLTFEW